LFAVTALWFARDIGRTGIGGNHDPGPHFFPALLATLLLVFGLWQVLIGMLIRRGGERRMPDRQDRPEATGHGLRWLLLLIVLIIYVASIGQVGFSLSTFVVAAALMTWLGNRWWVALIVSAAMVIVVKLLFVLLFHVQLPAGELGLPF